MLNNLESGDIIITNDHIYKVSSTMRTLRGVLTSMRLLDKNGWVHYINVEDISECPVEMTEIITGNFDHIRKSENVDIEDLFDMERGRDELIQEYAKIQNLLPITPTPVITEWLTVPHCELTLSLRPDRREKELKKIKCLLEEAENKLDETACSIKEGHKKYTSKYAKIAIEYATYLATEEHDKKLCEAIKEAHRESFPGENLYPKVAYPTIYADLSPERLHAQLQEKASWVFHQVMKSSLIIQYLDTLAESLYSEPIKKG